jgi:hypothetical protein
MVSVLSIVVARRDGEAVGAHATLRQAGHQPTEAAQRTMLHALARGTIARHPQDAVMPRYELRHEVLRAGSGEPGRR